jgi:hypothetical protein
MFRRYLSSRSLIALAGAALLLGILPVLPVVADAPAGVRARDVSLTMDTSATVDLPITASHVALHWHGNRHANVFVQLSSDGTTFGQPVPVETVDAPESVAESYGGVLWTGGASAVRVSSDVRLGRVSIVAIDASSTKTTLKPSQTGAVATVNQPAVVTRAGWGADESLRFNSSGNELWIPEFHPIQKLIVHHTAGRNGDPDPAATVRAIYYYDAVTQGWGDMGYNFLIDESGRIYEGRYSRSYAAGETPTGEDASGNGVTGAHVQGYNSGTVGIALLGTLTNQDATPAARAALEQLLAWKAERHAINPLGSSVYVNPVNGTQKTFANIAGHRDLAATLCPGGTFYATLPQLRQAVADDIAGSSPTQTVPGAPVLTASTPGSGRGVALSWTVPANGGTAITQYRVLRLKNGSFVRIATVGASVTTYRDTTAKRRVSYTYVVRAVNAIGVGPYSNQATATAR